MAARRTRLALNLAASGWLLTALGGGLVLAQDTAKSSAAQAVDREAVSKAPLGLRPVRVPADNRPSASKIKLGKLLFFDTRLSRDGTISCATCHDPKTGWAEHRETSMGINRQVGGRNAPTVINAAYHRAQFWDGRAESLEEQALGPIENPIEMGHDLNEVVKALSEIPEYEQLFMRAFQTRVTKEGIGQAIAAFERTILSGNSPYDRYAAGDANALTAAQKRGLDVFMDKADCATCHTPPTFSNGRYYNAGVDAHKSNPDPGRMSVTGRKRDFGRFRVPSLREIANTAPYFHDGSSNTLEQAVALMAGGGKDNPNLSGMLRSIREANLTVQDRKDLVDFLKALSGDYPIINPPKLP